MQFPTAAAAKKGSTFSYSIPTGRLAIVTEQHLRLLLSLLLIPAQIHLYYLDIFLQLGMYIYNEILELSKNKLPSTTQFR